MSFRSEAEPTRGSQIKRPGIARDLAHHEGQITAAQPLFQREQCVFGTFGGNVDQSVAQRSGQPGTIGPPAEPECPGILYP